MRPFKIKNDGSLLEEPFTTVDVYALSNELYALIGQRFKVQYTNGMVDFFDGSQLSDVQREAVAAFFIQKGVV